MPGRLGSARFALLIFLSLGVAAYAVVVYGFFPPGTLVHPDMQAAFEANRFAIYTHVFASALALAIGPFQFSSRLRTAHADLHRWLGRLYLGAGVLLGGLSGLFLAFHAFGGMISHLGFGLLAIAWLYSGFQAYRAIRARDVAAHRRWMVRNFSLTFAAVTLRLYLPASMAAGIAFEIAYPVISWLCWVPNLLVAELVVSRTHGSGAKRIVSGESIDHG